MAEITRKAFVSPVEAFQIAGQESFGSSWDEGCIADKNSELRRVALHNLRLALESGEVQALWHDFDYERQLKPIEAAGEFFQINLEKDCIHLSFFAGQPLKARIHVQDLKAFIRNNLDRTHGLTKGAETACKKWIVARIKKGERVTPAEYLRKEARRQFPKLSDRAFGRARKAAIEETGSGALRKGGRPRTATKALKT